VQGNRWRNRQGLAGRKGKFPADSNVDDLSERLAGVRHRLPCAPVYSASADAASPLVRIPQDEAPHHDETEWWYFSGHLRGFDNLWTFGTVIDHGVPVAVIGESWMDRQWYNPLGLGGWTWFSIQLSNNTQYMLYFIRDGENQLTQVVATEVKDGRAVHLSPSSVSETALGLSPSQYAPARVAATTSSWSFCKGRTFRTPPGTVTSHPEG
jgi:predicted secreted hydrolase